MGGDIQERRMSSSAATSTPGARRDAATAGVLSIGILDGGRFREWCARGFARRTPTRFSQVRGVHLPRRRRSSPLIPAARDMAAPQPSHEIIVVPAPGQPGREELRQQCYDVRIDVFHREQGFPLDTEIDESVARLLAPTDRVSIADIVISLSAPPARVLDR